MTLPARRLLGDTGATSPPEFRSPAVSRADANCSFRVPAEEGATVCGAGNPAVVSAIEGAALLAEIIERVNDLFGADTTDGDQLSYVTTLRDKMLESDALVTQAANNTEAQFANSPTLKDELMNAIIEAFEAHSSLSKQALDSQKVRDGLKEVLLGPAQLYEALRTKALA